MNERDIQRAVARGIWRARKEEEREKKFEEEFGEEFHGADGGLACIAVLLVFALIFFWVWVAIR
ncbi:hypothetical protein ACH4A8_41100 [Streptomyces vietnamensis]|uniref:hypothetical protein n=1 Tax=Streptomyces vietnamensis TaxID=362257 RepID=UPI00379B06C1